MKHFAKTLLAVAGFLLGHDPCRAQQLNSVWSEWETSAVTKKGPDRANGLFVYFHAQSHDALELPIAILFIEMAKVAQWDILRVNRLLDLDEESLDGRILEVVADEIGRARQAGYKQIIVGGVSRGGWLALLAAALPGVDAAIGLAPGTTTLERQELERTRDVLAQKLAGAKAKRIAAFFFDGDPREAVDERRSAVVRRALQSTGSRYMIVDRPADLYGHAAAGSGRVVRRYRDCLLQFVQDAIEAAGEVQCSRSSGYAIGSDIGFAAPVGPEKLPSGASPAMESLWGRWEGDDDLGTYVIMDAVAAWKKVIVFRTGYSNHPWGREPRTWRRDISFELNEGDGHLRDMDPPDSDMLIVLRPRSETELEFQHVLRSPQGFLYFRIISLRKQGDKRVNR
jgi:hypothetical protein